MNRDVHKWFHAIGDVTEIYGMTEDTGPATIGVPTNAAESFSKRLKADGISIPSVLNPIGKVGIPIPVLRWKSWKMENYVSKAIMLLKGIISLKNKLLKLLMKMDGFTQEILQK